MELISNTAKKLAGIFLLVAIPSVKVFAEDTITAVELIREAHRYDNMWASTQDANQQDALEFYSAALMAKPDDEQRLHILYRMGQLYGSAYQREKGERPDFIRAIKIYKEIIESYPPDEPLVLKAMSSIGDHNITFWRFDEALKWFKRVLEYDDLNELENQLEYMRDDPSKKQQVALLANKIKRIEFYQTVAVDQVGAAAKAINPYIYESVLRDTAANHSHSFISERAQKLINENMDRNASLWLEPLDSIASPAHKPIEPDEPKMTQLRPVEPNISSNQQQFKPASTIFHADPTAKRLSHVKRYVIAIATVFIAGIIAIVIRKKQKRFRKEEVGM